MTTKPTGEYRVRVGRIKSSLDLDIRKITLHKSLSGPDARFSHRNPEMSGKIRTSGNPNEGYIYNEAPAGRW